MEFVHKRIRINMQEDGKFAFKMKGELTIKPSLDACKKAIDKAGATAFEPFAALEVERTGYGSGAKWRVTKHNIVDLVVKRLRRYGMVEPMFVTDKGLKRYSLIADTPENRELAKKIADFNNESSRIKIEREAIESRMTSMLKYVTAKDFA